MEYHKTITLKESIAIPLRTRRSCCGERQAVQMRSNFLHLLTVRSLARPGLPVLPARKRYGTARSLVSVWIKHTGGSGSVGL